MAANSAEGGQAHIVGVLRAGRTLIVGVLAAEWGGGTLGPVAHLLTSYLGPLTFVTCPRPLLIHCLIFPTHSHGHHTRYHWPAVYEPALGPDLNGHPLVTPQYVKILHTYCHLRLYRIKRNDSKREDLLRCDCKLKI